MKPSISGPAHQKLHADPGAEREAGDPAGLRLRIDGLRPVERGRRIRQFAGAVVERALAAADAAEVEAQRREAAVHELVVELVDDLMVHRPAELRVRMQNDGDRRVLLPRRMVPGLDPSRRTGKNDFRHCSPPQDPTGAHLRTARRVGYASLVPGPHRRPVLNYSNYANIAFLARNTGYKRQRLRVSASNMTRRAKSKLFARRLGMARGAAATDSCRIAGRRRNRPRRRTNSKKFASM